MPTLRVRTLAALLLCLVSGCAHRQQNEGMDALRKAVKAFEERVRWKDFRGAMELLVPERREAFDEARTRLNDEKDLSFLDIETEDAQLAPDGTRAIVLTRYSWMRLPSTSVKSERVTSEWVLTQGAWLLARQVGGPFESELGLSTEPDIKKDGG